MTFSYITWDVNPEIVNVFGVSIRYYGLLFAGGLVLCFFILRRIFISENINPDLLDKLAVFGTIGLIAGARLGHCLFYEPSYYLAHPLEIILPVQPQPGGGYKFSGYQGLATSSGFLLQKDTWDVQKVRAQEKAVANPKNVRTGWLWAPCGVGLCVNKVHPVGFLGSFSLVLSFSAKRK